MSDKRLNPPRQAWETVQYEDDPFELGDVDVNRFKIIAKGRVPRPEDLVKKPAHRKVTLVLDDYTIQAFKVKANELGGSYQAMMRELLFEYARILEAEKVKG